MANVRPPSVSSFTLNPGTADQGRLLLSAGGSLNTIQIHGSLFNANSGVYITDAKNDGIVLFPFNPNAPVDPSGLVIDGKFTATGLPIRPTSGGTTTVTVTVVNTNNGISMSGATTQTSII